MKQEPGCVFCGIVADPSNSDVVWDDESVLAFMDINPVTDGHVLVIPKDHFVGLTDITPETAGRMMTVAQGMAQAMKNSELRCEGVNLFFADGEEAFQEVFHSHLHVFPRFRDDGFMIDAHWSGRSKESLAASAMMIREVLEPPRR
ncbi:HIT family protein [Pseudonocardia phyllosphaerae]|uniref:HIT family protein n=1 Tax=Pseudonocardia phyllosphaerae TaxID=3390502 RepID=UPI00397C8375